MDFELTVYVGNRSGHEDTASKRLHYTPDKLMDELHQEISAWNVLYPEAELHFILHKVPNDTPTIGINVDDTMKLGEQLN